MQYCQICVMPASAANGNGLDSDVICNACRNADSIPKIDWVERREMLENLVGGYKSDSNYDVVIGVSGGKDSYFQTHFAIHELGLKPLLVNRSRNRVE